MSDLAEQTAIIYADEVKRLRDENERLVNEAKSLEAIISLLERKIDGPNGFRARSNYLREALIHSIAVLRLRGNAGDKKCMRAAEKGDKIISSLEEK